MKILDADTSQDIRNAVELAMEFWPNAHLGTNSRRQDMRSAFRMLRSWSMHDGYVQSAIGRLTSSAYSHADM